MLSPSHIRAVAWVGGDLSPGWDLAARYGASVDEETSDPDVAYARFELGRWKRPSSWDSLRWA